MFQDAAPLIPTHLEQDEKCWLVGWVGGHQDYTKTAEQTSMKQGCLNLA